MVVDGIPDRYFTDSESIDIVSAQQVNPRGYCWNCDKPTRCWYIETSLICDDDEIDLLVCCDCGFTNIYEHGYEFKSRGDDDDD